MRFSIRLADRPRTVPATDPRRLIRSGLSFHDGSMKMPCSQRTGPRRRGGFEVLGAFCRAVAARRRELIDDKGRAARTGAASCPECPPGLSRGKIRENTRKKRGEAYAKYSETFLLPSLPRQYCLIRRRPSALFPFRAPVPSVRILHPVD